MGGETYSYRVKAFTVKQQNAEYSQSFTLTSKPFYPINLAAHTTDYRLPVPIFGGCGEEDFAMGEGEMMTEGLIEEELDDPVEPVYCPRLFGNDVTLTWSPAPNQKYPITNYFVKRIVPPNGPTWQVGTDTCLYICPNPYMSNLNYEIYAVNSNGDTSLPASVGGCTGSVNTCPGTPGKAGNTRNESLPLKFDLGQNRPNPFNLTTVISFSLPSRQYTRLEIFDVLGRMVKSLINGEMTPGSYDIGWDGTDDSGNPLSSGVYVYRLAAGHDASTKKMVMVK